MRIKTLKLLLVICLIFIVDTKAQPYIYYSIQLPDTGYENYSKVVRYNIASNSVEDFLPQQNMGEYIWGTWDPSQSYLAVNVFKWTHTIYDCSDTTKYFELEEFFSVAIDEILYSKQRSKLYIFSDDYKKISVLDLSTREIISETYVTGYPGFNILMYPKRDCFFSSDSNKIYFISKDSLTHADQVLTYSLEMNQITNKQNLLELGGYPGSLGYSLAFGRNGKGIIQSYPVFYGNPYQDFYYKLYNFDADTSSPFIYHDGECEAYFSGNGEFILIFETYTDTLNDSLSYYHTGKVEIYNPKNGELVKTLTLPSYGIVYTFDNYPNNIYYAIDIEKPTRQIYSLKMDSIFNVLDLTSLNPSSAIVNSSSFTLTVNGHGFDTLSTVYFNNTAKTTTYISDSVLTAEISATDISIVGSYPVWATDEWGTSDTLMFTIVPQTPYLSKISPSLALPYDVFAKKSSFNVMVIGNNFTTSSVAYFNGVAKTTTYISDSLITFQLSSGDVGTTEKTVSVWIQNSNQFSDTLLFNVLATLPNQITPILECVRENGANSYTAYFGYNNYNSEDVLIPFGTKNNISSQFSSITGSPVNIFLSGRQTNVFSIDFNGQEIFWNLNGTSVSASSKSPPCP